MDDYKRQFKTPGNQNWLKGAVAVNISKHGLAPFACKVVDHLRVETIKTQLSLDICENCSLPETIPCDLKNGICNEGYCTFHQGRSFHPCPILKCNDFRNDCLVKIDKGIPLGVTCNGCSTAEIVPCIQGNQVCRYSCGICKFHNDPKTNVPIKHRPCPKNICDALFDAIEINHRFGNPSWRNTDVRKMCFNSWHIAKCYMPREGYAHVENEESTDLNGIINVYINCKTFQNYFNADLSQLQNVCTKVREVGKQLRHATGLEVEEDVLKDWMYDLKNVFNDPIFLGVNQYAQFALDQLTKLEKDQIHIEQSDVVAAIDGITNSLKTILCNNEDLSENLREIKDNLKDLERLKRDILDEIKDETKRQQHNIRVSISDGIKTIEKAVETGRADIQEDFQKGILQNRGLSETNSRTGLSSEIAELKPKLLKSLLDFHKKNNSTLTLGPFFEIQDSRLEDFYVPPSLVKMCSSSTSVDDGLFEDTTETFTSLMQLLNPDNDIKQFIYITADAGAGKTSFCKFLVVMWCAVQGGRSDLIDKFQNKQSYLSDIRYLNKFFYVFYIKGREILSHSLEDIIFSNIQSVDTSIERNAVFDHILSSENILLILDGLDESTISLLTPPPSNRKYTIIITSRPWKIAEIDLPKHSYEHVQIEPMKSETSNNLLFHANSRLNQSSGTSYTIEDFHSCVLSQRLAILVSNPMIALQLLCLYHDHCDDVTTEIENEMINIGETRSHVYANIVEMMFKRVCKTHGQFMESMEKTRRKLPDCFEKLQKCNKLTKLIINIGKLAFSSLTDGKIKAISENDVEEYLSRKEIRAVLLSGLISATSSGKKSDDSRTYVFLHHTYQEFFACVYLASHSFKRGDSFKEMAEEIITPDFISFLCVMKHELGIQSADIFGEDMNIHAGISFDRNALGSYQSAILQAYEDCINIGIKKPTLPLKYARLSENSVLKHNNPLLKLNSSIIEILYVEEYNELKDINVWPFPALSCLRLERSDLLDKCLDLSCCTNLAYITLQNCRMTSITIKLKMVKNLWVYVNPEIRQDIPRMKITLAQGSTFSKKLTKLSLVNVLLDSPLDLSLCSKLSKLIIRHIATANQSIECPLHNLKNCEHIENLHFDTMHLSEDMTDVSQFSPRLEELSLVHIETDTSLDFSHCDELSKLVLKNVSTSTVNRECSLRNLQDCTNLENLNFVSLHISTDTNLDFSTLENLTEVKLQMIDLPFVVRFGNNIEEIFFANVNFPENTHLEFHLHTNLRKITLMNSSLSHVTVNPRTVKKLWLFVNTEMKQKIAPLTVSFAGNSTFSNELKALSCVHAVISDDIDISESIDLHCIQISNELKPNNLVSKSLEEIYFNAVEKETCEQVLKIISESKSLERLCFENLSTHVLNFVVDQLICQKTISMYRFQFMILDELDVDFIRKCSAETLAFVKVQIVYTMFVSIATELSNITTTSDQEEKAMETMRVKEIHFTNCYIIGCTVKEFNSALKQMHELWVIEKCQTDEEITLERDEFRRSRSSSDNNKNVRLKSLKIKSK